MVNIFKLKNKIGIILKKLFEKFKEITRCYSIDFSLYIQIKSNKIHSNTKNSYFKIQCSTKLRITDKPFNK